MQTLTEDIPVNSLGSYRRIVELGQGGMGSVYLAVAPGAAGFKRLVVLKELHPDTDDGPEFVSMFLDEARLSSRLHHPNIVQTYDVGIQDGRYFIAMEYLAGQPLRKIKLPLTHQIECLIQVLSGLHYAHELTAFDGKPLKLVHRDVSPDNIFVTYDGQTKIIDFGIAKGLDSSHETRAGVIRGKVAYMAPEQVKRDYDLRADVFAVGVILWEAIVGSRMWGAKLDSEILQCITLGKIPPIRSAAPSVDERLAAIVTRALARDPEDRYPTAAAMAADLEAYATSAGSRATAKDIGAEVASQFKAEQARMHELIEERMREGAEFSIELPTVDYGAGFDARVVSRAPAAALIEPASAEGAAPPASRPWAPLVAAVAVALLGIAWFAAKPKTPPQPSSPPTPSITAPAAPASAELSVSALPPHAKIFVDDVPLPSNPHALSVAKGDHTVRVEADGYTTVTEHYAVGQAMSLRFALEAQKPAAAAPGSVRKQGPVRTSAPTATVSAPAATVSAPAPRTPARAPRAIDTADPYGAGH